MIGKWIAPADDPSLVAVRARYLTAVERLSPRLAAPASRLVERLSTANWLLEWNLPRWLGQAFGLPPEVSEELVLANLYGLAYVRLQDDLVDGEVGGEERETSILLGTALYHMWLIQHVSLLQGQQDFWRCFDEYLGQWLRATMERGGPGRDELRAGDAGAMRRLAARGALLKVCCAAACSLDGQEARLESLEAGIDHLLAGAVLVDHAQDWEEDLASGRYNALVTYLVPREQRADEGEDLRQAVLEELYLKDAARPYLGLAQQQFRQALVYVRAAGVPRLMEYLAWAAEQTERYANRMAAEFRDRLRVMVEGLLSSSVGEEQAEMDA